MKKLIKYLHAKYRAFAPISCFESPRSDILRGWSRWRWLVQQRKAGRLIDPDVRVQGIELSCIQIHLKLGKGVSMDRGVTVWIGKEKTGSIELGGGVYVGPYAYLGTSGYKLMIGDNTLIGSHSYIITVNHNTDRKDIPYALQGYVGDDITIGKNVWIGCHVTILPGVTIGDGAIIGAGAVVTKNIPSGETWGGVPAKKIKVS